MSCEHLTELLSTVAAEAEEKILHKLILLKETKEETPINELETHIDKMVDYHDIILSLMTDREQETASEQISHQLNDVITHSCRPTLTLRDVMSLVP